MGQEIVSDLPPTVLAGISSTLRSGSLPETFELLQATVSVEIEELGPVTFQRGDCNDDGNVNVSDASWSLEWLFGGPIEPGCLAALDTNGDDAVNIADPVFLLNFLFAGGPRLSAPFPDCGPGMVPADEELGCANPPDCQ